MRTLARPDAFAAGSTRTCIAACLAVDCGAMTWTTPTFEEVKMDAEIGSYQEDTDPAREVPFARQHEERADE